MNTCAYFSLSYPIAASSFHKEVSSHVPVSATSVSAILSFLSLSSDSDCFALHTHGPCPSHDTRVKALDRDEERGGGVPWVLVKKWT